MRLHEILSEGDTKNAAQEIIKSVILPLKSQKVGKITVKQLVDHLRASPSLEGIDLDDSYVVDLLGKSKAISKVQADPENGGAMTVYLDFPVGDRQIDQKQAEREKMDINKAALRTIKKKQ